MCKKGSDGSDGSAEPGESATGEQLQRIKELVGDGMKEAWAREAVLGKGRGRQ